MKTILSLLQFNKPVFFFNYYYYAGTFGFQYKTEDGISHAAQGDPTGFIQGTYSYKDPTGLKVNFNYFAGNRATAQPQYNNPPPPQQYYR